MAALIKALRRHKYLESVDLSNIKIGDSYLKLLVESFSRMTKLKSVNLWFVIRDCNAYGLM